LEGYSTKRYKAITMKLFYHFLIFVFASLVLVACARIFTSDSEAKVFNTIPADSKQEYKPDSVEKTNVKKDLFTITNFDYKNILKTKRWTDNQCNYNSIFYIRNVQMAINQLGRHAQ
jgi:hypothetical protein